MNTESIANTKECNTDIDELMNDDKHQKVGNYSQVFGIGENCEFGEINVAKFHEICNNLQEQLTAAQELSSRYEKELSGERFYRKDLESKLMALSLETETKVGKCYETNKSVEERLELLATKQETDLRVMQVELNTARCKYKMISDNLLHLDRKYQKLLGLNREKASDMREKCIELPQGVDQLQFLALQLREELIETRAAYEHSVSELKNELIIAKEQLQDVENLLQESELRNSPFLASELQDSSVSTKVSDNDVRYQAIIAELEHKVISTQKERNNSELALAEMRRKCATLQNELDTCETVQKDFVRLSQQLQIQLEKLRQSEKEVRWQFDEDVSTCNTCDTLFNEKNTKSEKHHCRHCGKIFCGDCLVNIVNCGPNHREAHVCNVCYTLLNRESVPFFSHKSTRNNDGK